MNQCDVNYRQSSNKRLLVELTLIEVAQITQPDEGPVSGRKPRRLKSLFKHLMQQPTPQTAAPQVAVAKVAHQQEIEAHVPEKAETPPVVSLSQPKLKAATIGMSWGNLRRMTQPSKMNILAGTLPTSNTDENVTFTQDDLELQTLEHELEEFWYTDPQSSDGEAILLYQCKHCGQIFNEDGMPVKLEGNLPGKP